MKVYIKTYGCTTNQADSDIIRGILKSKCEIVNSVEESDTVIINSCGVIDFTERKILKTADRLRKMGKRVIITGCLSKINPESVKKVSDFVVPIREFSLFENLFDHDTARKDKESREKWMFPRERIRGTSIAIVQISEGCLGRCSYCAAKIARGRLKSFPPEVIVKDVRRCVESGYREIQLTSQDTGVYGRDLKTTLPELLNGISEIDGDFRVRVGMMNPGYLSEILDDLIESYRSEKIYKFIHVPVQSGDNYVLAHMKRGYTVEEFLNIVKMFRKEFDDVVLSTDVIAGYPVEDEKAFSRTVKLIERIKPDILNITRFSKRKGTEIASLKDIPEWIKKERSRKLTEIQKKIGLEKNRKFLGDRMEVLITRKGKNGSYLARTDSYRPVILKTGRPGDFVHVEITGFTSHYLIGEIRS